MSLFNKLHHSSQGGGRALTTTQFFTDGNVNGYSSRSELSQSLHSLNVKELRQTELFFQYLNAGKRIRNAPLTQTDRASKEYLWCEFDLPKGTPGLKIVLFGNFLQFIKDYQEGLFSVPFSLEELYDEAQKSATV